VQPLVIYIIMKAFSNIPKTVKQLTLTDVCG